MVSIGTARAALDCTLVVLLSLLLLSLATVATADELPLVLTNESVGMTGAEIEASQAAPPVPEPATETLTLKSVPEASSNNATGSEFVSNEDPDAEEVAVAAHEPAPAAECAVAGASEITSFGHCVETSIRGGVGFDESARVCRALFPERG